MHSWNDRIARTSYRFMRVSRATGEEVEQILLLKGGTVTRNDDVRVKESAEAELVGSYDFGPDLVRVWMDAVFPNGESESVVLGTFLPVMPSREITPGYSTSSVKMYGRLQEILDDKFASPITVEPGSNAVAVAKGVCQQSGLEVIADDSSYVTTNVRYYGVGANQSNSDYGDTKLDMVNDLLSLADFRSAFTDQMGRVMMRKYHDPADIAPSWSMEEGPLARFEGKMSEEFDYTDTANHVVVLYGGQEGSEKVVGEAFDTDPNSPFSTASRGRVITSSYTYNDLPPGDTAKERQDYANSRAKTLLSTAQSVILRVSATHAYAPFTVNDTVDVKFPSGGVQDKFQVRAMTMRLLGGCPTDTEFRRFRRRAN